MGKYLDNGGDEISQVICNKLELKFPCLRYLSYSRWIYRLLAKTLHISLNEANADPSHHVTQLIRFILV